MIPLSPPATFTGESYAEGSTTSPALRVRGASLLRPFRHLARPPHHVFREISKATGSLTFASTDRRPPLARPGVRSSQRTLLELELTPRRS
jgi:hypothetical protein